MPDPLFTPATARRALRRLRPAAERMCRLFRAMRERHPGRIVSDSAVEPGYFSLVRQLHAAVGEIQRSGARVRDPERGLLDFPARRQGRPVLLCWMVGESDLAFWREPGSAFSERHRVDEDGAWEA